MEIGERRVTPFGGAVVLRFGLYCAVPEGYGAVTVKNSFIRLLWVTDWSSRETSSRVYFV